jgi:hypothetical protein
MTATSTVQVLRSRWLRPAATAVLCVAVAVALAVPATTPVRTAVLVLFFVLGPGLALIGLLRIREPWQELALVIGVSLALDVVVSSAMAYGGDSDSVHVLEILLAIAVVGGLAQLAPRRSGRHSRGVWR